jgi:CheY-like chemotaxis protein
MDKSNITEEQMIVDFRDFRPGVVILLDFVKHSKRSPAEVHIIQNITEDILNDTVKSLSLTHYLFTHTGDGWMCILLGDDSARAMDFVNLSFTALRQRLDPYKQTFRVGMDYGLLHFRKSEISMTPSHFEVPGIQSARLESAAKPQQILCTDTVRSIFSPHYVEMFSVEPVQVQTKDRDMLAYEVTPLPLPNVRKIVSDLFFAGMERSAKCLQGTKKILIIDDDTGTTDMLQRVMQKVIGVDRVVIAYSGEEALRLFRHDEFAAIVTDVMMPYMNGIDLAYRIAVIDPDVPVIFISGYYDPEVEKDDSAFDSGVVLAIQKPIDFEALFQALCFATAFGTPTNVRSKLRLVTDDPIGFLRRIMWIANVIRHIIRNVDDAEDVGHSLLRHKAKRIADEVIRRIVPGGDVVQYLESAATQLHKILLLCSVVRPLETLFLEEHITNIIEDYTKANKKARFVLDCSLKGAPPLTSIQSVALLVTAEFVDNALDAVKKKGRISVDVRWEKANQQLCIEVTDDGPGVAVNIASNLFLGGQSTKGVGRGMGLGLVNQACKAFHGTTRYVREDNETSFISTLRLPESAKSLK